MRGSREKALTIRVVDVLTCEVRVSQHALEWVIVQRWGSWNTRLAPYAGTARLWAGARASGHVCWAPYKRPGRT